MSNDKEKSEKHRNASHAKAMPKEAQVIASILKEQHCDNYDARVINQMLDYSYRYCTGILQDAKHFAQHSQKKTLEVEDIRLALKYAEANASQTPLSREQLMKLAESKNCMPLPAIKPHCGLRLPPDRYAQLVSNYRMKQKESKKPTTMSATGKSAAAGATKAGKQSGVGGAANVGAAKRVLAGAGNKLNPPKLKLQQQQQQPPLIIQTHPLAELKNDVEMDVETAVGATLVASSIGIEHMET